MNDRNDQLQEWIRQLEQAHEYGMFFDKQTVAEMLFLMERQQQDLKRMDAVIKAMDKQKVKMVQRHTATVEKSFSLLEELQKMQSKITRYEEELDFCANAIKAIANDARSGRLIIRKEEGEMAGKALERK
ncbi:MULTISPECIES: hypothetical protein [Bacillaceae]|uniref:Uncharacterized protein n=1 Tax=Domibacillus aminovorans TaxID=29332 RepID=A0A177KX28_9BACI|nr:MULTISPECIES: hypothetical protein [Bacillaceae]OAH57929.1 hypothetical protein AWH48_02680 [Domibacillus aminovorans]